MTKPFLIVATMLYLVLIAVALRPGFDLDAARLFYVAPGHFIGQTRTGTIVRYVAWCLPFAVYIALLGTWVGRHLGRSVRQAPTGRGILFLTLSLAIGPGVLVHGVLKEISHRPRPYSVTQFDGTAAFRPFYRFDGSCGGNCSFASGETAAATWMLAPASLVPPPWRSFAIGGAFIFAAGTGLFRMAFGAHFLSDVCAAMLIVILLVLGLYNTLVRWGRAAGVGRPPSPVDEGSQTPAR